MRRRTLIFSIAAVLALAAGIAALSLWPETPPDPAQSPPPAAETFDLIKESQDNVTSIVFSPRGGTPYAIRRDPATGDCELDAAGAIFPGRQPAMRSAHAFAAGLTSLTRVTENADDTQLTLFGLDKPVMTWRVNRADGTSAELMAGAEEAAGNRRYARRKDSREVFLLTELQSSYLTYTLEDVYDLSFFPYSPGIDDEAVWPLIENVLLEKSGEAVIELRKRSEEELSDAGLGISQYQITRPAEGEGNAYLIQTVVLEPIVSVAPGRVETLLPADLSAYGLDDPARLTASAGEWSGTLLIGRHDAERGGRYVMIEGHDAVLFDSGGDYRFLNARHADLRIGAVWLHDIKTVSSLTFDLGDTARILRFEHDYDEEDAHTLRGWLDDIELSEVNARRLYMFTLRITQDGASDADIPPSPPEYRVTMAFLDGGSDTIELYRINDLQFLIVRDGANTGLFINRMTLQQEFLNRFDILDRGGDLPSQ